MGGSLAQSHMLHHGALPPTGWCLYPHPHPHSAACPPAAMDGLSSVRTTRVPMHWASCPLTTQVPAVVCTLSPNHSHSHSNIRRNQTSPSSRCSSSVHPIFCSLHTSLLLETAVFTPCHFSSPSAVSPPSQTLIKTNAPPVGLTFLSPSAAIPHR